MTTIDDQLTLKKSSLLVIQSLQRIIKFKNEKNQVTRGLNSLSSDCYPSIHSFTCRKQSDWDITAYLEPHLFEMNTDYIIEPNAQPLGHKLTYQIIRNQNSIKL